MNLWLGNTPKKLYLFVKDQEKLILPYGVKERVFKILEENEIPYEVEENFVSHPINLKMKTDLSLYDYQEKAIKEVLKKDNGILVSPAGSGKTRMAMALIKERNVKTLWLTHTLDLLRQSKRVYRTFFKNMPGEISGGKINIKDVTFATVQTLNNVDLTKLKDTFEMVIVDEVHRVGGTPTNLTMFYKTLSNLNARYKYGLTATIYPKRNDSSMTPLCLIGDVIHEVPVETVPRITAEHIAVFLDTPQSEIYLNPDLTLNYNQLVDYLVYDQTRNNAIYNSLERNKDRFNLVLSNRNDHLEILHNMLYVNGIESRILTGDKKKKERDKILNDFKEGKYNFLLSNYQLAKEGLDIPIADTLHLVMPMRDKRTVVQSKGRIERLYKDKKEAYLYDYVDKNIGVLIGMYNSRKRDMK